MRNNPELAGPCQRGGCQQGSALILVLVMVVILGLAAGLAGQTWKSLMQRAMEAELLWRGQQYRQAIGSYYQAGTQGTRGIYPASLEELVKDPRFPHPVRHLRRLYDDPMTKEEWALVKGADGRITGVRSTSTLKPFRQDGFPEGLESFRDKQSYREWEFVFTPAPASSRRVLPAVPAPRIKVGAGSQ